jgi:acyl-CoA synthetase (AMP-forming)/AMP-acid ligase II
MLDGLLREGAARVPGTSLTFVDDAGGQTRTTTGALLGHAERFAATLRRAGLRPGEVLAVRGSGTAEIVTVLVAGLLGGFTVVPVLHTLGPADVEAIVADSGARVLVSLQSWHRRDYAAELAALDARCAVVVVPRSGPDLGGVVLPGLPRAVGEPVRGAACVVYSSGTTGRTKGVVHTGGSLSAEASDSGGAAVPPALIEEADRRGLMVFRAYGSSEHPTVTGPPEPPTLAAREGTDGRPTRGSAVRIDGGEIVVRGPEQFAGYLHGAPLDAGGWFRTGDLGHLDADGNLVVTGRLTEILIRGGENISLAEVEQALRVHPDIVDAALLPVPDDRSWPRCRAPTSANSGGPTWRTSPRSTPGEDVVEVDQPSEPS